MRVISCTARRIALKEIDKPFSMVNDEKIKRKKRSWNKFMRTRNRLSKLKKNNPQRYYTLTNRVITDLNELEKAVSD